MFFALAVLFATRCNYKPVDELCVALVTCIQDCYLSYVLFVSFPSSLKFLTPTKVPAELAFLPREKNRPKVRIFVNL